jgi:hypothetical protein
MIHSLSIPKLIIKSFGPMNNVPSKGGQIITIIGSGFISSFVSSGSSNSNSILLLSSQVLPVIMCSFGGIGSRNVIIINETVILCITPSIYWLSSSLTQNISFDICGANMDMINDINNNNNNNNLPMITFKGKLIHIEFVHVCCMILIIIMKCE